MARIFTRGTADGTEVFALQDKELESMTGLFVRAGIGADIIQRLVSKSDTMLSEDECRAFSKRIKMLLSLRMVIWNEEIPTPTGPGRSLTPKLVSKTIDKNMRARCTQLVDFLASAGEGAGSTMHTGSYDPRVERTATK